MGEVGGVRKGRRRGGGQVGGWGRSFIWQVQQWRRGHGRLIRIQQTRGWGGAWKGGAVGGTFHRGGGA